MQWSDNRPDCCEMYVLHCSLVYQKFSNHWLRWTERRISWSVILYFILGTSLNSLRWSRSSLKSNSKLQSTKFRSDSAYSIGKGQSRLEKSTINADALVIGALESAYVDMVRPATMLWVTIVLEDHQIAEEKQVFKINGGCAVISATILLGKVRMNYCIDQ